MKTSRNIKNKQTFRRYMQEKLALTVTVIMLALLALVGVLYFQVKNQGAEYNQIVLSHQDYESRTIPYKRGNIIDRNGTYLATSQKVYNLILDPRQILNTEDDYNYLEPTLDALSICFGYDKEALRELINRKSNSSYVVYEKKLSADVKDAFENYQSEKNDEYIKAPVEEGGRNRIVGVWFEDEYKRFYPYNELACNVIGFALRDNNASGGVEQYYNDDLTGVNGREFGYLNDEYNPERTVKQAVNGNTVQLTIDVNVQKIVERYLNEWQATVGSKVAACIVMDPRNGEILAMDTTTRFNLNDPYDLSMYYSPEAIAAMEASDDTNAKTEAWYAMWRNFCVNDTYEPGSPQKPFTVAGAMEEGTISGYESYVCGGKLNIGGWDIRCVARSGHGPLDVTQGLMKSCNVVMMNINAAQGAEKFLKHQKIFGFGEKTGIDLPGEADTSGLVYTAESMDSASLATNSFGQNYNCTMIQMASAFCSLINGGSYYQPHVMKQVLNEQGAVIRKNDARLVRETVSENTSAFIRNALYQTVSGVGGTAGAAQVPGYEIGGKTGTAQKQPRSAKNYLVSFIGFAPAFDPQVVCYVVVDTPNLPGEEQAHSTFASGIFAKIMTEALPYLNVFPAGQATLPVDDALAQQNEGIIVNETEPEVQVPETMEDGSPVPPPVSFDEEFIDSGQEDYNYPDAMPTGLGMEEPIEETQENADAESGAKEAVLQAE